MGGCSFQNMRSLGSGRLAAARKAASGCIVLCRLHGASHMYTEYHTMENLTQLERFFLELLRGLNDQQRADILRIMEALQQSAE